MKVRFMLENCDDDDGTSSQMMPYRYTYISYLPCVETKERAAPITAGRKNFMMLLDYLQLTCTVLYLPERKLRRINNNAMNRYRMNE